MALTIHASTVAFGRRAVLIRGPSGSGKSGLALQLMALGAALVADDQTRLMRHGDQILTRAPETIRGQIEARGMGILAAQPVDDIPLHLIVDMGLEEPARLPPTREDSILGLPVPLITKISTPHFPAAITLYLHGKRIA